LNPVLPGTAVVADRALDHNQVLSDGHPSGPEAQVRGILAAPLPEVGQALESLARLRKFKHRILVVHLVSAIDIHAQVFPVLPQSLEQDRMITGGTSQVILRSRSCCLTTGASAVAGMRLLGCNMVEWLVGQEDEVARNGPVADESHGYLVAGCGEEPIAVPDYDRVKHQPYLIDEMVL